MLISACSKSALEEDAEEDIQVEITKQDIHDLIDAGTFTYADEIRGEKVDVVSAVEKLFTAKEREDLLVDYLYKTHYPGNELGDMFSLFFENFRKKYESSFFENIIEDEEKEIFCGSFLDNNFFDKNTKSFSSEVCTYFDLNCPALGENCIEESNLVYYRRSRGCTEEIVNVFCAKSPQKYIGDTGDCDYSYDWSIIEDAFFDVNNNYRWRWWNTSNLYSAVMVANISGYKYPFQAGPNANYFASTFIGNRHRIAMLAGYGSYDCHDDFIADTRFLATNAPVIVNIDPEPYPWPTGPNKNSIELPPVNDSNQSSNFNKQN